MESCLRQNEGRWRELFGFLEEPSERLAAVVQHSARIAPLADRKKVAKNLVPGCVSRVWLCGEMVDGQCFFEADGDSAIVRALALMACDLWKGCPPETISETKPALWQECRLVEALSPSRQNGLAQIECRIRELAAQFMAIRESLARNSRTTLEKNDD